MKYFDDPGYDSKFKQFIDLFAELIEKYGGDMFFPEERKQSWENSSQTVQRDKTDKELTSPDVA